MADDFQTPSDPPVRSTECYAAWVSKRSKLLNKTEAEVRENTKNLQDIFGVTEQNVMDFVEEVERENSNASTPASGSAPPLPNKFVALEGRLEMERHPYHPPITCDKNCRMDMKPFLCGIAHRKDGAANVVVMLEALLENFNGKYVRIIFETEALNDKSSESARE